MYVANVITTILRMVSVSPRSAVLVEIIHGLIGSIGNSVNHIRRKGEKMSDTMKLIIEVPKVFYEYCKAQKDAIEIQLAVKNGIPLEKNHGRIVDIGKIDKDRMESYNPILYLTVDGEYIEAVSLNYLNSLPPILEESEEEE